MGGAGGARSSENGSNFQNMLINENVGRASGGSGRVGVGNGGGAEREDNEKKNLEIIS